MSERTLEEFLSVVTRALAAESAAIVEASDEPPESDVSLRCDVPGGRRLVVTLKDPPKSAADREALQRRLEMLAETFADMLPREGRARPSRPPVARTLREELGALVQRAGASDAVIIDAHSPVIWGSMGDAEAETAPHTEPPAPAVIEEIHPPSALHAVGPDDVTAGEYGLASAEGVRVDPGAMGVVPRAVCARHRILPIARNGDRLVIAMAEPRDASAVYDVVLTTGLDVEPVFAGESMAAFFHHLDDGGDTRTYDEVMASMHPRLRATREPRAQAARDAWARTMRARRAMNEVRALPEMASLKKGGHLRHMAGEPDFGYLARSFAAIYVLVLIFDRPFEELLAKRAVTQALPSIERLVAALPPLEPPPPTAGVAAMRARRRR